MKIKFIKKLPSRPFNAHPTYATLSAMPQLVLTSIRRPFHPTHPTHPHRPPASVAQISRETTGCRHHPPRHNLPHIPPTLPTPPIPPTHPHRPPRPHQYRGDRVWTPNGDGLFRSQGVLRLKPYCPWNPTRGFTPAENEPCPLTSSRE